MTFHIITIFPHLLDSYFKEGMLKQIKGKGLIEIKVYDLRNFTSDSVKESSHLKEASKKEVDDRPFGGGPGMVLKVEPIYKAVKYIKENRKSKKSIKTILLSAKGKKFSQDLAYEYSKLKDIILICGRYEGVDERAVKHIADEEVSIGDYILSGGELPAMVIVEAVARLLPGALGNKGSLEEKRKKAFEEESGIPFRKQEVEERTKEGLWEEFSYPVYTRPAVFNPEKGRKWKVPDVLLSGDHKKIKQWREKHRKSSNS